MFLPACRTVTQNFCKNAYNVSGLCSRQACPLANAKYATVREMEGELELKLAPCAAIGERT